MASGSASAHPPLTEDVSLETKRVRLLPLTESHLSLLHQWRNSPTFLSNCTNRRNTLDYDTFLRELDGDFYRDRHEQFVVQRRVNDELIGTVYSYNLNKADSYAFITIFLKDGRRHAGYGIDAIALFLQHLFATHSLFKVYMEVYEYNTAALSAIKKIGVMTEEGRFRKQRLWHGIRYDVLRFTIFADSITAINDFLRKIR